jgi:ketosteroid isomerase-like protein
MDSKDADVRRQTRELAESYLNILSKGRFDELIELLADDGTCEFPFARPGRIDVLRGKSDFLAFMKSA